jgi:hypothetical protein
MLIGVNDVAQVMGVCVSVYGHDWLPWLRLDNGSFVTRCTRCGQKEQWDR